jgi:ribonuclease HII
VSKKITPNLLEETKLWAKGYRAVAGVDEAGRGPLAGPVVAAAVIFDKHVQFEGVFDSKLMTEKQREAMYGQILLQARSYGIGIVDHKKIDEINILQAAISAMNIAIDQLTEKADFLLIDGNKFHHPSIPFKTIVHGDAKCFTIAAASILAKVTRDRIMREMHKKYPVYGFEKHKGYGTVEHRKAIELYGLCEIHRTTFKLKQLEKKLRLTILDI